MGIVYKTAFTAVYPKVTKIVGVKTPSAIELIMAKGHYSSNVGPAISGITSTRCSNH
jgi:hypothetical protein